MEKQSLTRFDGIELVDGYERGALERYAAAAVAEQDRLRAAIADARAREARAVQALAEAADAHGLLGRMLLDGQRSLEARRNQALVQAAALGSSTGAGNDPADAGDAGDAGDEADDIAPADWTHEDFISFRDALLDGTTAPAESDNRVEAV